MRLDFFFLIIIIMILIITIKDFEIQTVHLIPARRRDLVSISKKKKRNLSFSGFYCSGGPKSENERKRKKVQGPCQRVKKKL